MIKYIIITAFILCITPLRAQMLGVTSDQWNVMHLEWLKKAPYIFEGKVIKQKEYSASNEVLYTCNLISITKIFKGNPDIALGTIKVLVNTARVQAPGGPIVCIQDAGEITPLKLGGTYIILGDTAPKNIENDSTAPASNSLVLTNADRNSIVVGASGSRWNSIKYNSLDSLYSFMKANGVTLQQEAPETNH